MIILEVLPSLKLRQAGRSKAVFRFCEKVLGSLREGGKMAKEGVKGSGAIVHTYVSKQCPHCQEKVLAEIKINTPISETPEGLLDCPNCKKQILVHCLADPHDGSAIICFIKYPVIIVQ
ncbi:MAG: hypothetical protein NTZ49_04760 [Candidatus Parcubacteria bacterium]|nr:hypothetical protein [Candidatus Parcubacteria bacterium]